MENVMENPFSKQTTVLLPQGTITLFQEEKDNNSSKIRIENGMMGNVLKAKTIKNTINQTAPIKKIRHWGNGKTSWQNKIPNKILNGESSNYMYSIFPNSSYPGVESYTRYAVARLGLIPLDNVEPLKPEFGSVINDVLSFQYRLTIPSCRNSFYPKKGIFIAVTSAPGNFKKRMEVRQTWKKHLKAMDQKKHILLAGFAFIMGTTDDELTQSKIIEENKSWGDIIQIELNDTYANLTLKNAALIYWLYRYCTNFDYVLKYDDDVYVNVRNLVHFVQLYKQQSNYVMLGSPTEGFIVNRSNND